MSDDNFEVEEAVESELDVLKMRADTLGIKYHPNIGVDKLKEKIEEAKAGGATEEVKTEESVKEKPVKAETEHEYRTRMLKEAGRLRRIRVTCMNPMKAEWEGEIFTSGNGVVGNFRKYVPFETEWHVPQIILNMIEDRMYQTFYTVRDPRTGQQGRRGKLVKEFAVEILPDLTKEELKALAQRQAMARGTAEA